MSYELFNIPISFKPEKNLLRKQFLVLSRKYHPDHFIDKSDNEKQSALEYSANLNNAYKILQNDFLLMEYILRLKGILNENEKNVLSQDFMLEMMDWNEMFDEVKLNNNEVAVKKLIAEAEEKNYLPIQDILDNFDEQSTTTEELIRVKDYYLKKKYFNKLLQE